MMLRRQITEILVLTGAIWVVACSNASLFKAQTASPASAVVNFCTTPSTAIVTKLKYLFVTDISGSNQQNFLISGPNATPVPDTAVPNGTDPTGVRRYSGLVNFLQTSATQNLQNVYYAGMYFNGNQSPQFPAPGPNPYPQLPAAGVTEDANVSIWYTDFGAGPVANTAAYMAAGYENVWCSNNGGSVLNPSTCAPVNDGGWTDYIGTLTQIQNYIQNDIIHEQQLQQQGQPQSTSAYVIFWTSDGFPYNQGQPEAVGTILQDVKNIMDLKSSPAFGQYISSITLNTAFYFTTSTQSYEYGQALNLMTAMANLGQGTFLQISAGQNIPYQLFSVPQQNPPFVLRDFWVQDASAVWWPTTGGVQLMLDSDNDGIPDTIEKQWGTNPNAYDSDGNGVGDGVEYYLYGTPCGSISVANLGKAGQTCTAGGARNVTATCGAKPYLDSDLDYLNDCEETLLGSDPKQFDSNQDWVPDQFEFSFSVPFVAGTNGLTSTPANDNVTNYQKLKDFFPINIPVSQIHVPPQSYNMKTVSSNAIQTCYQATVTNIPVQGTADNIRVYIMEQAGVGGAVINRMRTLIAPQVVGQNGTLVLNDGNFTP